MGSSRLSQLPTRCGRYAVHYLSGSQTHGKTGKVPGVPICSTSTSNPLRAEYASDSVGNHAVQKGPAPATAAPGHKEVRPQAPLDVLSLILLPFERQAKEFNDGLSRRHLIDLIPSGLLRPREKLKPNLGAVHMRQSAVISIFCLPLISCGDGNADAAIRAATEKVLNVKEGAQFGNILRREVTGIGYACATVEVKNRLGMSSGPQQVPVVQDNEGQWRALEPEEGQTPAECMTALAQDLSGANDSIPPSSYLLEPPKATKEATTEFDRNEVRWSEGFGDNVIQGQAILKTRSGQTRLCDREPDSVALFPVSTYARERMKIIYGNDQSGFRGTRSPVAPADPLYAATGNETGCDENGRFLFQNIPDGDYFVAASVFWKVYKRPPQDSLQGGVLMQRVQVAGGEVKKLSLSAP